MFIVSNLGEDGPPRWCSGKEPACQHRRSKRPGFNPWVGKISWSGKWQPTLVFLPGKSLEQRSLVSYSPWGHKESNTTKHIHYRPTERKDKASQMKQRFRSFDCFFPDRSLGKESTCNARDPSLIPESVWFLGQEKGEATHSSILGLSCGSAGKESSCNVGDTSSIPGLGRFPGERKVYPLQYSSLENSTDSVVHGFAKSRTRLEWVSLSLRRGSGLHHDKHASGHADGRPTYRHYSCCLRSHNSHFAKVYVFKAEFIPFCIVSLVPKILNSLDKLCESWPPLSCSLALKL